MEPEASLPCPKQPTPDTHSQTLFLKDPF